MKTTPAYTCICQDCGIVFDIDKVMVNVIDIDKDEEAFISFLSSSLNRVTCPHCFANFTYEIPMLIYSQRSGFAVKVDPYTPSSDVSLPTLLPYFFSMFNFKYRQVTYHIEALEKVRIFKDGLDDRYIEYIKLNFFSDDDATPMEDVNLCYKSSDNEKLYFEKLDYNGKLIKEFDVLKAKVKTCGFIDEPSVPSWQKINRYTVEDYIYKEETT